MEEHECAVWATCVDAAADLPGNPLDAVTDRSGPVPLVALRAADRGDFNRVVGLGVRSPARPEDIHTISSFYDEHHQQSFRIEVTPLARPSALASWISDGGLDCQGAPTFKMWRLTECPPAVAPDIEVRRLGSRDRDALTGLSVAAWGAWSMPVSMTAWFGATVGIPGARHYGVFDADRLVATGALFIGDGLGWFGFDATHPRYQGRKLRQAISSVRMVDSAAEGCPIVHAESAVAPTLRALRDGWQVLYEKQNYSRTHVGERELAIGGTGKRRGPILKAHSGHR